jgi:ADP-ribosylglycohydrolase
MLLELAIGDAYGAGFEYAKPHHVHRGNGWMSVRAAITAVQEHDSLSEILKASIAFTGDVDTVATIALGSASCSPEISDDLPPCLIDGLENGEFGRNYLATLDYRLFRGS